LHFPFIILDTVPKRFVASFSAWNNVEVDMFNLLSSVSSVVKEATNLLGTVSSIMKGKCKK
jgi:hypothetical protein